MELAHPFISVASLSHVEPVARGLECVVFKATSPTFGRVALRVPKVRVYQNANDPNLDAKDLIQQELRIYELLSSGPVPVPKPFSFLEAEDGYPAMLAEYVDDDGSEALPEEIAQAAAHIHNTCIPEDWDTRLVAQESEEDALVTLVERIDRRMKELIKKEPEAASWIPSQDVLLSLAKQLRRFPPRLLHMDLRDVNLRVQKGKIVAVLDWSNAIVGPAVIDVFRILELGQLDDIFLEAYKTMAPFPILGPEEEAFLRLDAALMLALVFISEAPDPVRRVSSLRRVKELAQSLL